MGAPRSRAITIPTIDVKKYGGKQLAVADGAIVAVGRTLEEVIRKVRRKFPTRSLEDVHIVAVPKTVAVIYHV